METSKTELPRQTSGTDCTGGERHLDETELAARWGVSVKTLRNKRVTGGFVPYVKISRNVRYRLSDILEWEEANLHRSTSEGGGND